VRIRKIDPLERDSELIDGVMQSWVEAAAAGWEEALRRQLGGPAEPSMSVEEPNMSVEAPSQLALEAPSDWIEARPAVNSAPPEEDPIPVPALFGGLVLADPLPFRPEKDLAPVHAGNGNGDTRTVASPNGDGHVDTTMAQEAPPVQAPMGHHPAISHHRRPKHRRRPNKRWKKRTKARRR
jgi:hypothetical protein